MLRVTTLSINEARPRLTEVIEAAVREPITITKNGRPVALVISAEAWLELQATLEVLSNPGMQMDLATYAEAQAAGELTTYPHDEVIGQARRRG